MQRNAETEVKINIFALPNQTTILFILVVGTIIGAVAIGSICSSPIPVWPLALALVVLPFRAFLGRPEREFAFYNLAPADASFYDLMAEIEDLAENIGLPRVPQLFISSQKVGIYVMGTFRRWYLVMDQATADRFSLQLKKTDYAPSVQASLIHELYHFKTGDYWQLGFARELLRTNFCLMTWALVFYLGWGLILLFAAQDFVQLTDIDLITDWVSEMTVVPEVEAIVLQLLPSPEDLGQLQQKAAQINMGLVLNFVISATWPFVIIGLIIWGLYWPRLWRVREFYADAGMVHELRSTTPGLSAVTGLSLPSLRRYPISEPLYILKRNKALLKISGVRFICKIRNSFQVSVEENGFSSIFKKLQRVLNEFPGEFHPDVMSRISVILDPGLAFDNWRSIAFLTGSLTLLLEFLLMTPLTLLQIGQWPMHFSTLIAICIISFNYIIPSLVKGQSIYANLLKIVAVVSGIRFILILLIVILLVILLLAAPEILYELLCTAVATTARFAGYSQDSCIEDLQGFVIEASIKNIAQALLIPFVLLLALILITILLRRLFTWYSFPNPEKQILRIAYCVIFITCLFLGLTVLPMITGFLLDLSIFSNPLVLISQFFGVLFAVGGLISFLSADKKYGKYCPKCGKKLEGSYYLGRQCCGSYLHSWLITGYEI